MKNSVWEARHEFWLNLYYRSQWPKTTLNVKSLRETKWMIYRFTRTTCHPSILVNCNQGWKLQNNAACPSDMRLRDLPVWHYVLPFLDSKYTINVKISAFPSDKCLNFLPVHLFFYLSRTGGQSIISIPGNKSLDILVHDFYLLAPGCPTIWLWVWYLREVTLLHNTSNSGL